MNQTSVLLFFLLLVVTSIFPKSVSASSIYDLSKSSDYNLEIVGPGPESGLTWSKGGIQFADLDQNGKQDLILTAWGTDYNSLSNSGSLYVIYDSILEDFSGTGKQLNLSDSANWNIRFDGSAANEEFAQSLGKMSDLDGDGHPDLVVQSWADKNGRTDSGSIYVIYYSLFQNVTGVGNTIWMNNSQNYNFRIDGAVAGDVIGYTGIAESKDLDGDGLNDLLFSNYKADNNSRTDSGSVYLITGQKLASFQNPGIQLDLLNSDNYSLRIDGASASNLFGYEMLTMEDINHDSRLDLIASAAYGDSNSRTDSGSVFIIANSIIRNNLGVNKTIDLSNSQNFSVRLDGAASGNRFGFNGSVSYTNQSEFQYLLLSAPYATFGGSNAGSLYVINDSIIGDLTSAGTIIDISDSSNFSIRIDAATGYTIGVGGAWLVDIDYNGMVDILSSFYGSSYNGRSQSGSLVVWFDGLLDWTGRGKVYQYDTTDQKTFSIRYDGEAANDILTWNSNLTYADVNNDGRDDIIGGSFRMNGRYGGLKIILNFPHTVSLDPLPAHTTQDSFTLTGSVSAPNSVTNIAGVEWSLDNNPRGTWTACSASDGSFNSTLESFGCEVSGYTEGTHQIYVRAYDTNTSYTASSHYASVGKRKDVTAPKLEYIVTDPVTGKGYEKTFKATALNAMDVIGDTHFPQFCFTKAYDDGAGVASYTIVVDGNDYLPNIPYNQPPVGDNGDTRQEGDSIIKENSNHYIKYHLYNDVTKQQEVCAYGKTDRHYLEAGVHKWSVKATDNAGNSTSTDTLRFLVMTNQGVQSKPNQSVWFPLTLLQVGNRTNLTNYSTTTPELFTKDTKPLIFSRSTPTFYGIAPVGARLELTLYQDTKDSVGVSERKQVSSFSTTANQSSEWGINITTPLTTGTYYVTIQATDTADNFAILKDIPLKLTPAQASTVLGATTDTNTSQVGEETEGTLQESEQKTEPSPTEVPPSPTSRPRPTPTPTPNQFCIWKWCW